MLETFGNPSFWECLECGETWPVNDENYIKARNHRKTNKKHPMRLRNEDGEDYVRALSALNYKNLYKLGVISEDVATTITQKTAEKHAEKKAEEKSAEQKGRAGTTTARTTTSTARGTIKYQNIELHPVLNVFFALAQTKFPNNYTDDSEGFSKFIHDCVLTFFMQNSEELGFEELYSKMLGELVREESEVIV